MGGPGALSPRGARQTGKSTLTRTVLPDLRAITYDDDTRRLPPAIGRFVGSRRRD